MKYPVHPYPRFGLAYTLFVHRVDGDIEAVLADEERLARMVADVIDETLDYVRLHTDDRPDSDDTAILRFRYVPRDQLRTSGQTASNFYYLAPHVATDDSGTNRLIGAARTLRDQLRQGKGLRRSTELKRSFSPFTAKINEGKKSLSNPRVTRLQAAFTLLATLSPEKPAAQVNFTNQVIIPDLDLKDMIRFIDLFQRMKSSEVEDPLIREIKPGKRNYRPPIFDGNYPNAPRSATFGPVGLLGAMGRWIQRAEDIPGAEQVIEKITKRPLYLVSYDQGLMRQAHIGHHVAKLALHHDLPRAISSIYRAQHYNAEANQRGSKPRELFYEMAARFLQTYSRSAFRDFLAFRVHFEPPFSPIMEDYFMNERKLPKELVQSARAYGAHLNYVAYLVADREVEENKKKEGGGTGRGLYEAKTRVLAQMESTAMSAKRPSALFARLNVDAGRMSNRDVPPEATRFIEAVTAGEVDLDTAKELVLAFMRLRSLKDISQDEGVAEEADPILEA